MMLLMLYSSQKNKQGTIIRCIECRNICILISVNNLAQIMIKVSRINLEPIFTVGQIVEKLQRAVQTQQTLRIF